MAQLQADRDVIVIGGGMAGLASAYRLSTLGFDVTLLEGLDQVGGRVSTRIIDGQYVDVGATFIAGFYTDTRQLLDESGLSDRMVHRSQPMFIAREKRIATILPLGQLVRGSALTWSGRLGLLGVLPALVRYWESLDISELDRTSSFDRNTAAQFGARYLGSEASDYFFNPLIRGFLYWEPETSSAAVVLCILKSLGSSGGTYRFATGMQEFAKALGARFEVLSKSTVTGVSQLKDGFRVTYVSDGCELDLIAKKIVCATPAPLTIKVLPWLPSSMRVFLEKVSYSQTAVLTFAVPTDSRDYPQGAILFPTSTVSDLSSVNPIYKYALVPGSESYSHQKLLNVYLSNEGARDLGTLTDAALAERVLLRVNELLGAPDWVGQAALRNVQRWPLAIPRFNVGYIEEVQRFKSTAEREMGGIAFAGDYLSGPYVDGAIRSGLRAAAIIARQLA